MSSYLPPTETRFLPENGGFYEVRVGDRFGWVTSHHLIEQKANQLRAAWLQKNQTSHGTEVQK